MAGWKHVARLIIKAVAVVAAVAFLLANPLSNSDVHIVAFFASIPTLILCFVFWQLLGGDEDRNESRNAR